MEHRTDAESPGGELITRDDGSQVIKVKKRKRRSQQKPKKLKTKQNPYIKWALILFILTLVIVPAFGVVFIIAKYNGKSFKELSEANIKEITSTDRVQLNTLKVTPISVDVKSANLEWSDQFFLKKANFKKLSAKLNVSSFLSKNWISKDVIASSGSIRLQTPHQYIAQTEKSRFTDSIYQFDALRCQSLDLYFGTDEKSPVIKDLLATLRKVNDIDTKIIFQHGALDMPNWPALDISSGILSDEGSSLSIKAILESDTNNGEIKIDGSIKKSLQQIISLNLEAEKFPIRKLLGPGLTNIFGGNIDGANGELIYDFSKPSNSALRVNLPFKATSITLSKLPLFSFIADITANSNYRNPESNYCSGNLTLTANEVTIQDLDFISNNLITLRGNISSLVNGDLKGKLEIGIPTDVIKTSSNTFFSKPVDGFHMISVNISGNVHNPHDNFKEQYRAQESDQSKPALKLTPEEEFDALTR